MLPCREDRAAALGREAPPPAPAKETAQLRGWATFGTNRCWRPAGQGNIVSFALLLCGRQAERRRQVGSRRGPRGAWEGSWQCAASKAREGPRAGAWGADDLSGRPFSPVEVIYRLLFSSRLHCAACLQVLAERSSASHRKSARTGLTAAHVFNFHIVYLLLFTPRFSRQNLSGKKNHETSLFLIFKKIFCGHGLKLIYIKNGSQRLGSLPRPVGLPRDRVPASVRPARDKLPQAAGRGNGETEGNTM